MRNTFKNSTLFGGYLLALLTLYGCKMLHHHRGPEDPVAVKIQVVQRSQEIKDSLQQKGVDSILIYTTDCKNCVETPYIPSSAELKKADQYILSGYLRPTYIIWMQNEVVKIKRIDQHSESDAIDWDFNAIIPLFDFYGANKAALNSETYCFGLQDTLLTDLSTDQKYVDTVINTTSIYYYEPDHYSVSADQPLTNFYTIHIALNGEVESLTVDDTYFKPIAPASYEEELKKSHPNEAFIVGNDHKNYRINYQMKRFIWQQQIAASMHHFESTKIWKL
ncbi:MAG: hypothetical protein ACFHU9_00670 [Fluviicola sp.]